MFTNYIEQPIIVIGMHRSGTTMLAEALHRSGIFMGVMRDHNGEAFHFLSLNQQMLEAAQSNWLNPSVPPSEADRTLPANVIYAEHIKKPSSNPIKLRLLHNRPWGWKDPRNTFTLDLWLKRFPRAKVIHVIRDGRAVARSLNTRNQVGGEVRDERLNGLKFCFELWEKYVAQGQQWRNQLGDRYLELRFEELAQTESSTRNRLDQFVGKPVSTAITNRSASKQAFSPELQALASHSELFKQLGYSV